MMVLVPCSHWDFCLQVGFLQMVALLLIPFPARRPHKYPLQYQNLLYHPWSVYHHSLQLLKRGPGSLVHIESVENKQKRLFKWKHKRLNWEEHVEKARHTGSFKPDYHMSEERFNKLVNILREDITVGVSPFLLQRTLHSQRFNYYIGFCSVSILCFTLCNAEAGTGRRLPKGSRLCRHGLTNKTKNQSYSKHKSRYSSYPFIKLPTRKTNTSP